MLPFALIPGARNRGLDAGVSAWSEPDTKCSGIRPMYNSDLETQSFLDYRLFAPLPMRFTAALLILCFIVGSLAYPWLASYNSIPPSTYNDLVWYTKYSSGAYQLVCLKPLGNHLVESVSVSLYFCSKSSLTSPLVYRSSH